MMNTDYYEKYQELISRACDGECTAEELEDLREHLTSCAECRRLMRDFADLRAIMAVRSVELAPPRISSPRAKWTKLKRAAIAIGAAAGFVIAFLAGCFFGVESGSNGISASISSAVAVTPSMWTSTASALHSEHPFTESIRRCRLAVVDELRRESVDWVRVRSLVETMGELRTDLELLTVHLAYIDITTGKDPTTVSSHWENLSSGRSMEASN